jgi:cell division protein ZapE
VSNEPTLPGRYAAELAARGWQGDAAQAAAVARLEQLRLELQAARSSANPLRRLLQRLLRRLPLPSTRSAASGPRGAYLHGGVGRGKTWLMDLFFDSLAGVPRRRIHFHHLMREVHAQLATIRARERPLQVVAARMARRARLWCLDELHVHDIADAMLLGALFEALLAAGCTLVVTANVPPRGLYRDGLQRARFLPAIALLEQQLELLHVDGGTDYRLRQLRQAPIYLPAGAPDTPARLAALFAELAGTHAETGRHLQVGGRSLHALRRAGGVAWFSFATLCEGARSASDYAQLAADFHTVFLADVPILGALQDDAARRLVMLVDEFYDQGVKLVVSAAAAPAGLYRGERLAFEFQRTSSRLVEMQSEHYLALPHQREADPDN